MTVEQAIARLRELAALATKGQDVSAERAACERVLADNGIRIERRPPAVQTQGGSRFGSAADLAAVHAQEREALQKALAGGQAQLAQRSGLQGGGSGGGLAGVMQKALAEATPSAGRALGPVEVAQEIADLVRARIAVMNMGPTTVPVQKELDLPALSTGATAYYIQEGARIPVSEETFSLTPVLRPIELAALVPVNDRLLRDAQTLPQLEEVLRGDLAQAIAGRADLAFLQGLGGGNEPLGVRNQPNIIVKEVAPNGGAPTLLDFRNIVGAVRGQTAPFTRPGWIFHPDVLTFLETMEDTLGRPLLESEGLLSINATGGGGTFLGYPFRTTSRIPTDLAHGTGTGCTYVLFSSDWNECWIGENLALTIEASNEASYSPDSGTTNYSAFQQRQTLFRAITAHDIALRRPQFFACLEGVQV